MISAQLREATLEVDLAALRHNLRTQLKQIPGAQVLAVVKANAYGNGLIPVATCLNSEPGIAGFCVAMLDEGRQLRDVGTMIPICLVRWVCICWAITFGW